MKRAALKLWVWHSVGGLVGIAVGWLGILGLSALVSHLFDEFSLSLVIFLSGLQVFVSVCVHWVLLRVAFAQVAYPLWQGLCFAILALICFLSLLVFGLTTLFEAAIFAFCVVFVGGGVLLMRSLKRMNA